MDAENGVDARHQVGPSSFYLGAVACLLKPQLASGHVLLA